MEIPRERKIYSLPLQVSLKVAETLCLSGDVMFRVRKLPWEEHRGPSELRDREDPTVRVVKMERAASR